MSKFFKYHGAGNDFILIEDYDESFLPIDFQPFIQSLCDRFRGIGADGILLIQPSAIADVRMRIFNSDGQEAMGCGNGLRCIVKHLEKPVSIETAAGVAEGLPTEGGAKVTLPKNEIIQLSIPLENGLIGHHVDTGVPHLVVFTREIVFPGFLEFARRYRNDPQFQPNGVNVTAASYQEGSLVIRTFERGIENETQACGTGGAAAALVAHLFEPRQSSFTVIYPSKEFAVYTITKDHTIWMEGPAERIFEGIFLSKIFVIQ